MDNHELERRISENRRKACDLRKSIDNAFQINQMQRQKLVSYEDQIMVLQAELRSMQKQFSKKPFSLKNLFKKN